MDHYDTIFIEPDYVARMHLRIAEAAEARGDYEAALPYRELAERQLAVARQERQSV